MGAMSRDEWITAVTFVVMVAGWVFGSALQSQRHQPSRSWASACCCWRACITLDDIAEAGRHAGDLPLARGPFALSAQLNELGFMGYVGERLASRLGGPVWPVLYLALIALYVGLHYLFVSQTSQMLALFGVFLDVGTRGGVPVPLMALGLLFASSYFSVITPQGGSQNIIFVASGYLTQRRTLQARALTTLAFLAVYLLIGTPWMLFVTRDVRMREKRGLHRTWRCGTIPSWRSSSTLAIGFLIGRVKFGSFSLGIVVGTLLAGVLIGQLDIKVPAIVKTIFFDLFLFTTGYKVGPQFFRGLKGDALPQVALTVGPVRRVSAHGVRVREASRVRHRDGRGAPRGGVLGVHGDRHRRRGDPAPGDSGCGEDRAAEQHSGRLCRDLPDRHRQPRLVPSHDRAEADGDQPARGRCADAGRDRGGAERRHSAWSRRARIFDIRAYRVTNPDLVNKTVAELEALPARRPGLRSLRIRHGGEIIEADPGLGHSPGRRGRDPRPARKRMWQARATDRPRSGRQGPARHPDRSTGRDGHEPLGGRKDAGGIGTTRVRPWRIPAQAHARRAGDPRRRRYAYRSAETCCA